LQVSYFGSSATQLFGAYSPPAAPVERDGAVLLCPPGPHEYMRSHWALRQLALKLSAAGLHVLRFDYSGTGDSAGASEVASLEQWRRDVLAALDELRDVSGVRRVSVVGLRLGATLAAQASAELRDLVLWEPVTSGPAYLQELRRAHTRSFAHCLHPPPLARRGPLGELLGHPLPAEHQEDLERLQLEAPLACRAERVTILAREPRRADLDLAARLAEAGTKSAHVHVPEAEDLAAPLLLSGRAQERIVTLLGEPGP
jgi:pimeloyl-ACP methyl ester carboxylesterase